MVGLQIRTLNIFTVFKKNEYSLYQSIPADGSIPAVTYINTSCAQIFKVIFAL